MKSITLEAYGKINFSLDVLGRRENGYHDLKMIMQQIDLKDIITLKDIEEGVVIECDNPNVPTDTSNLVYKAYEILSERYDINRGIHIKIEKNIPVAAGLAGGSSNAAAVLKGLNKLWNLDLSTEELMDIGVNIGADVPYCMMGGTALAEGIGEILTPLNKFSDKLILIANPNIEVSTAYVYNNLKLDEIKEHPNTETLIKAIKEDDLETLSRNMMNLLESVTIERYPVIKDIKDKMIKNNALGSLMSGSGPTVFGVFDNVEDMIRCKEDLIKTIPIVIMTKTC